MCNNHDRKKPNIKFANLHCHTGFSVSDGVGSPKEHLESVWQNGMDAMAITEHGHMNSLDRAEVHAELMAKEGKPIKYIKGMEAYFIPSIKDWQEVHKASKSKSSDDELNATIVETENRSTKDILKERRHLTLLAKNETGLKNLFQMVSQSHRRPNFYYYPRIDYDMLREHHEGLIATTSCVGGVLMGEFWKVAEYNDKTEEYEYDEKIVEGNMRIVIENMLDIFGDDFYGEVQWNALGIQHILNQYVIKFSKEYGFDLISTCDSHYPTKDAWQAREMHRRLGNPWIIEKDGPVPECSDLLEYELYPKNGDEIWESYKRYSEEVGIEYDDDLILESIERTQDLALNKIDEVNLSQEIKLPDFVVPEGKTADETLAEIARGKLRSKGLDILPEYYDRLEYELDVIKEKGFSKYFLTTKEMVDIGKQEMLVGAMRGSGGGCLTSYLLDISEVDPLKYGLQFERFLRKSSNEYPDIDLDFSQNMEMKEILIEKWGQNNVVSISNWNRLKLKSLIKDLARYFNVPYDEVNEVTSKMDEEAIGPAKKANGIKAGVYKPTYEEIKKYSTTLQKFLRKYPEIDEYVDKLYNNVRSCGRHAGGLVVSEDLHKNIPLIASKGVVQTPWDKKYLEKFGFIKFDILGLTTLEIMELAIEHILKRHEGIENPTIKDIRKYYDENLHPDVIDLEDQAVYESVYHDGKFAGTFQFTEGGVQGFCQQVKPRNIPELSATTAIYRPGPLASKVDEEYTKRKENPSEAEYINDTHKKITEESFGLLIFQEQISELTHKFGKDISLEEGNVFMKILTKRQVSGAKLKKKKKIKGRFIEGCLDKGLSNKDAEKLYERMEWFSQYSFNKSHSTAYSIISFQSAWLLHYYPSCWLAAYLSEQNDDKTEKAISVVRSLGYEVDKPNINFSSDKWEISDDGKTFYQPLTGIKGIGDKGYEQILEHRPFNKIEDLLFNEEIDNRSVNKGVIDVLVRSQALKDLVDDRFTGSKHFWSAVAVNKPKDAEELEANIKNPAYRNEGKFSKEEEIAHLFELTKIYPLHLVMSSRVEKDLRDHKVPPISEWPDNKDALFGWCVPIERKYKKSSKGNPYWELQVIDDNFKKQTFRCWGIDKDRDMVHLNRPYMVKNLQYSERWGFSLKYGHKPQKSFVLLG